MRHLVCFAGMLLACLVLCFCKPVHAADAVRIYLELSGKTATAWPGGGTDYLRGRVVLLDANNELATTFGGKSITDTQLLFQSNRFGADVYFSTRPSTDLDLTGDWETGAESLAVRVEKAWQEFAVSYDNISEIDNDTLVITLKTGATTITAQRAIDVQGPPANCYVVRTGGLVALDLLDEIPSKKEDGGSVKTAGASTLVDVFAAFYNILDGKYYYTNNLPEGGESVTLTSPSTDVTLVNGHYQTSLTPSISSTDYNATTFNTQYKDGKSTSFSAESASTSTRWMGNESDDVTANEYINITTSSQILSQGSSSFKSDTSTYKPNRIVNKITIVGLPLNEVTSDGTHKYAGLGGEKTPPAELPVSPYDAFKLLADKTAKPSLFKVPGKLNQTCIYGAIVGYDADGDPAPFTPGYNTVFYLKKQGGSLVNSSGTELAAVRGNGSASLFSGSAIDTKITTTYAYQAFLPFKITATAVDGTTPSIDKLYISEIKLWNSTTSSFAGSADTSLYSDVNEETEGVSFIAQDTVGAITLTDVTNLNGKNAGEDAEVQIKGINGETSFGLRVFRFNGSSTVTEVGIGNKGSSSEVTSPDALTISGGSDTAAEKDVAFFTAVTASASTPFFFIFSGLDKGTNVIQQYPPTGASDEISILASDPDDFSLSSITSELSTINTYLDEEEEHNTIAIAKGVIEAKDLFSNAYGATGVSLDESGIAADVYLPAADGTASETEFPGASAKIDGNEVDVEFGLSNITSSQSTGILKLTSRDGALSQQITMNLKAAREIGLKSKFVPVPGITDTPVQVFIADQNGDMIAPVTITAANDTTGNNARYGNTIEAEITVDNGTLANISNDIVSVTTKSPYAIITAKPDTGKESMLIEAETRRYATATLLLTFIPDFEKPVVADILEGNCRIDIEITDNQAVDLENTDVTIISPAGEDITATLTRGNIYDDNNTSGIIRLTGFPEADEGTSTNYSAVIIARDQWGNERDVSRIFAIECIDIPTQCVEVDPAYGVKGETETITIKGENTNFVQGTTQVSFSCDNATVASTEVKSSTEVVVTVVIGGTAPPVSSDIAIIMPSLAQEASGTTTTTTTATASENEICDITVTTGTETLTCSEAFEILSEPLNPVCMAVTPSVVTSGQTTDIVITGTDTKFTNTTAVSFDCPDITVNSKTADSATQLTVNISSSAVAATTTCNVTVGDITCPQLTLLPSSGECRLTSISRTGSGSGYFLPRVFLVAIRGNSDCSFSRNATISFGSPSITAVPLAAFGNRLLCLVTVSPRTPQGAYEITVDGIGGITFTIR